MMSFGLSTELTLPGGLNWGDSAWLNALRSRGFVRALRRIAVSAVYLFIMFSALTISGVLWHGGSRQQIGPSDIDISSWAQNKNPTLLQPAKTPAADKPRKAAPAPAPVVVPPVCNMPQSENTTLFAACAEVALDFTTMPNGPFSSKYFRTYVGAPEANGEAQYYSDSTQNVRIENGALLLQAHKGPVNGFDYTSARIDTKGKTSFQYGKIRVKAMMPKGHGTWPAIWMLSNDLKYAGNTYVGDPERYLYDGEIDIAESVGTDLHTVYGIAHALNHHDPSAPFHYFDTVKVWDNERVFHDYGIDWTPTSITYSIDERPFFTFTKQQGYDWRSWPYDQSYYLIINLALGGSWGSVNRAQFPKDGVDPAIFPATFQIQSIRYYPYIGPR